jgi:hypothetical protein
MWEAMTVGKRADRIERLKRRANILGFRISAGTCTKLDEEKAELSALEWAIKELESAPEERMPNLAKDAEEWGNALNEASWEFLESYSRQLGPAPAALFNSSKTMVRDAILKYVRLHMNSGSIK